MDELLDRRTHRRKSWSGQSGDKVERKSSKEKTEAMATQGWIEEAMIKQISKAQEDIKMKDNLSFLTNDRRASIGRKIRGSAYSTLDSVSLAVNDNLPPEDSGGFVRQTSSTLAAFRLQRLPSEFSSQIGNFGGEADAVTRDAADLLSPSDLRSPYFRSRSDGRTPEANEFARRISLRAPSKQGGDVYDPGKPVDAFLKEIKVDAVRSMQSELFDGLSGMGGVYGIDDISAESLREAESCRVNARQKLGELASTAICGNDITASCFYIVGELAANAGIYSPICTALSSFTLFCFRSVYGEVVTALPLNGGIYNLLLNSSTKRTASVTACLTILSYTATGVVSAVSAADYIRCSPYFHGLETVPTAVGILAFFAVLMIMGMQESSVVASLLFLFHLSILFILAVFSILFLQDVGLDQLRANMVWEEQPSFAYSIFFGFSSAMLGVSGFETSANFVEEQRPGVFPKTLTNMWISVSFINICLPTLAICIIPMDELVGEKSSYAVAIVAERVGGSLLRDIVAIDALLVLSGSVLTSYVGVCGLFQRMAGDRCLPQFFAQLNDWRGTPHYTIISFFAVCASMCILLNGNITQLAAIYSISFLLVMALFAFCGLWMKIKRPTLPRQINTHPVMFILGLGLVATAFTAVVLLHPAMLTYFYIYYGITVLMVMTTFARVEVFTFVLSLISSSKQVRVLIKFFARMEIVEDWVKTQLQKLRKQGVVYFTKSGSLSQLNLALQYIEANEEARWVRVIHVYQSDHDIPQHLLEYVQMLDCVYPKTRIDCILVRGEFGPGMVQYLSKRVLVPVNCMFINCPKHDFKHPLDTMGGVRVIQNSDNATMLENFRHHSPLQSQYIDTREEDQADVSPMSVHANPTWSRTVSGEMPMSPESAFSDISGTFRGVSSDIYAGRVRSEVLLEMLEEPIDGMSDE